MKKTVNNETSNRQESQYIELEHGDSFGAATQSRQLRIPISAVIDVALVHQMLNEEGIVFLTGITSEADMVAYAQHFGIICHHRDSDHIGVTHITQNSIVENQDGYRGFSSSALSLHTDRSATASPPSLLLMACGQPASSGGVK